MKNHFTFVPVLDRWRTYYERRKSAGLCVRNGCDKDAMPDKTLCEKHGRRSREYWQKRKERVV